MHVWTVTSGFTALSAHIETDDMASWETCVTALAAMLREKYDIAHVTLQPEPPHAREHPANHCSFDEPEGHDVCLTATKAASRRNHAGHRH